MWYVWKSNIPTPSFVSGAISLSNGNHALSNWETSWVLINGTRFVTLCTKKWSNSKNASLSNSVSVIACKYINRRIWFLHHEKWVNFRSIRSQMFFKTGVLKMFAISTGKHLCWSLFLIKLQASTLLKRCSNLDVFL